MPTNYVFGSPSLGMPRFAQSTVSAINNTFNNFRSAPIVAPSNRQQSNISSDPVSVSQQRSNDLNDWSKQQTQVKLAQQKVKQTSLHPTTAAQSTQGVSNVDYSGLNVSDTRRKILESANSLVGTPYAWGGGGYGVRSSRGTGRGTQNVVGVDCSGLTSYAYGTVGIKLPHNANAQLRTSGYKTAVKNLSPGDLVGWAKGGHVAVYLGNGRIQEAPAPGGTVRIRALSANDFNSGVYGVHIQLPGD